MIVTGEKPLKRLKRKATADFYNFPPSEDNFSGEPFRTNVRSFLTKHALLPPPSALFPHLLTWQIMFRVGGGLNETEDGSEPVVCLDVVEEDVARSRSVYCDQCRVVGELTRLLFADSHSVSSYALVL
ncbi:PHD finger protein [Trifolium medium]|uniref:PHD finger protein n=1 Tax=Trifolium medium TaxID=97028 RepID=A0A392MFU0_9FABA|nr:PHD finger protein [Trifolium medium]